MKTYFIRQKGAIFSEDFCVNLVNNVKKEYVAKAKENNELLADVADPVTESDISIVSEVLFTAVNVTDSKRSARSLERCLHDRLLLCWDRGLVGRISEVVLLTTICVKIMVMNNATIQ
jgi:hypothetical protein